MRLEVVNLVRRRCGRIEDAVAAMHDVVVEREHHQRGVGDDALQLAGIERPVLDGLPRAQRP